MLGVIFGLIAVTLVLIVEFILGTNLDFSIMNLTLFYFIPIGSYLIGRFIGWAIGSGLNKSKVRVGAISTVICVIVGLSTFIGIKYMEYETTYIDMHNETLNREDGVKVSECIGFVDYTKFCMDELTTTFSSKYNREGTEIDTSGTINYLIFFVEWILCAVGVATGKNKSYVYNNAQENNYVSNGVNYNNIEGNNIINSVDEISE